MIDCVSMQTMRREGLTDVLTNDRHFEQEGFLLPLATRDCMSGSRYTASRCAALSRQAMAAKMKAGGSYPSSTGEPRGKKTSERSCLRGSRKQWSPAYGRDDFQGQGLSGATAKRPALLRCLKTLQPGDTLTVWKLDRLGHSLRD